MKKKYNFSYSRINTFNNCPQKYKIQYIDKVSNKCNSIEAYMGQRVHQVLEELYNIKNLKNQFILFDQLIEMYNKSWTDNWDDNIFISKYKYDKNYYNKFTVYNNGLICLKNYYNRFSKSGYFKENIYATELEIDIKIGDFIFKGFIDRVDIDESGIIDIIDYKNQVLDFNYKNLNLVIPHEKLSSRNFVLIPLQEIFPNWKHPKTKEIISSLIENLSTKDRKSILKIKKN